MKLLIRKRLEKMLSTVIFLLVLCFPAESASRRTIKNGASNEAWDYVDVRPGAHMFYWLYETTHPAGPSKTPLVMWLQGGPGGSSTGFGNFEEIGPLDSDLKPRNTTWLSEANLLFVDNPVGTGYSYVDSLDKLTTDVAGIAADLLVLFKAFLKNEPMFQNVPFYIFSESYGGKMAAGFSAVLYNAIKSGEVTCNFQGFAMGDSWISPVDSTNTWAPYTYGASLVDLAGFEAISTSAKTVEDLVRSGKFKAATDAWGVLEDVVEQETYGVNFYNILMWGESDYVRTKKLSSSFERLYQRHVGRLQEDLDTLMNGPIRQKLGIIPDNVTWGGQSGDVFDYQSGDFMVPVDSIVDALINKTSLHVVVFNGQLDLIVDTIGTENWVQRLTSLSEGYRSAKRVLLPSSDTPQYYRKNYKNFSFYWILDSGHMVPSDNGPGALLMLKDIIYPKL